MRLKNKKTGEIGIINYFDNQSIVIYPIDENWNAKGDKKYVYHSIAELNAEWCDYEEPEEYWYLSGSGEIRRTEDDGVKFDRYHKEIGNYFSSREEAEKAVEKLKAWKRLEDKCFRFYRWNKGSLLKSHPNTIEFACDDTEMWTWEDIQDDLDLLFGGEE